MLKARSWIDAFQLLLSYPTIGDFLAYQFVTDINYSEKLAGHQVFARMAELLTYAAEPDITWDKIKDAVVAGTDRSVTGRYADVRVSREDWKNVNLSGYELVITIVHHCDEHAQKEFLVENQ